MAFAVERRKLSFLLIIMSCVWNSASTSQSPNTSVFPHSHRPHRPIAWGWPLLACAQEAGWGQTKPHLLSFLVRAGVSGPAGEPPSVVPSPLGWGTGSVPGGVACYPDLSQKREVQRAPWHRGHRGWREAWMSRVWGRQRPLWGASWQQLQNLQTSCPEL